MAQQIINTGANANDGTGEPLRQAFTAVNENFTEIYTAGPVGSDIQIVGNVISTIQTNQNLTLRPDGIGVIQANSSVIPSINLVYDLGSPTQKWDSIYSGYFFGNGAFLTGISGNSSTSNSFSTISANGVNIVANSAAGILTLTPGNNIIITGSSSADSVTFGVSSSPSFTGNVIAGNIQTPGRVAVIGNITSGNLSTGNITAGNLSFTGRITGNLSTTGNVIAGNVIATERIIASSDIVSYGNVAGTYMFGNGAFLTGIVATVGGAIENGQSNVRINSLNANVTVGVSGTSNVAVFSPSGVTVANNISAGGSITAVGNVTGNYFIGNGAALTEVMADRGIAPNNWNNMTQMGVYTVNRVSWSGTTGTPLDSQVYVGLVEVKNSTNTALEQVYYPGTLEPGNAKIQWNRTYWSGTWSAWLKIVNDDQVVIGGAY